MDTFYHRTTRNTLLSSLLSLLSLPSQQRLKLLVVKMLSKETEVHCQAQMQATEAFQTLKEFCHQMQTQLQHQDQEFKVLIDVKDHRYKKVLLALKECDAKLEARCHTFTELMQKAEKRIDKLQENIEVLTAQLRWSKKDHEKSMEEKDAIIQRLHEEVKTTQTGWDKYISHVSTEMVVKKTEMINLHDREFKLRDELDRGREEIER
ncbi:coiled-coil domain-containing protein 57 isoform X2 [Platichthys flesus]|nr:coiled-coil domain-containing protein 57 isoform X2 [Platichthys flesus]